MQLTEALIQLNSTVADKKAAIAQVAQLLIDAGKVQPEYLAGMYQRESQANTYLGNGVAIPHGTPETRQYIKESAIAVLQIHAGIAWGENGERVQLVVGIAASDSEHLTILRRLTRLLNQSDKLQELLHTTDKNLLIQALSAEDNAPVPASAPSAPSSAHRDSVRVPNPLGFHARPATNLAKLVKGLDAPVFLVKEDGSRADASKMMAVLGLAITPQTLIHVESDSASAVQQVVAAIQSGLGDDLSETLSTAPKSALWAAEGELHGVQGICASDGLVIGTVHHYQGQHYELNPNPSALSPWEETKRFNLALAAAAAALQELAQRSEIFGAHLALLQDEALLAASVKAIASGARSENAYAAACTQQIQQFERSDSPVFRARAADVQDVRDRVIRQLLGLKESSLDFGPGTVLCADNLTPSDTAKLNPKHIAAFITAQGGATSHSAILARGMGIPAISGVKNLAALTEGATVIVDANGGTIYLQPTEAQLASAQKRIDELKALETEALRSRHEPGQTADGKRIEVVMNVNQAKDLPAALELGGEGVGLMRTEFLYLESDHIPSEDEQEQAYRAMAEALGDKPLIIRTLDIGGDKEVAYLKLHKEENAFLGTRGIRLCLLREDLFLPQLRAICRVAKDHKNVKVMFPMIATLQDWHRAKGLFDRVAAEVGVADVPVGIMIEVPAAALIAEQLAKEVAFFSVGTNDLTQYTLAMDRMNADLAPQTDPLHPAVLQLIATSARHINAAGKWIGVCGGLAGDGLGALVLVGLGVTELSVSPKEVVKIKNNLKQVSSARLAELAAQALKLDDGEQVRELFRPLLA